MFVNDIDKGLFHDGRKDAIIRATRFMGDIVFGKKFMFPNGKIVFEGASWFHTGGADKY